MLQPPNYLRVPWVFALCGILLLSGCMSTASVRLSDTDDVLGIPRYYHQSKEVLYQTAQDVVRDFGLQVVETVPEQSYIVAQRGITGLAWGIVVGVYVSNEIDQITRVVIRTEPKFAANLMTKDVTAALHAELHKRLSGQ